MARFRRTSSGVVARLTSDECDVLARLCEELEELVSPPSTARVDDLEAMLGPGAVGPDVAGAGQRPEDPVLARLLPDAYPGDDTASTELRRLAGGEVLAGKAAGARTLRAALPAGGGKVVLDEDGAVAWVGALNDLRLALGTRLEVTATTFDELAPDDPRMPGLAVYDWLGGVQERLLRALAGR